MSHGQAMFVISFRFIFMHYFIRFAYVYGRLLASTMDLYCIAVRECADVYLLNKELY